LTFAAPNTVSKCRRVSRAALGLLRQIGRRTFSTSSADLVNRKLVQRFGINVDAAPRLGLALVAFEAGKDFLVKDHGGEVLEQRRRARRGRNLFPLELGVDAIAGIDADFFRLLAGSGQADISERTNANFLLLAGPLMRGSNLPPRSTNQGEQSRAITMKETALSQRFLSLMADDGEGWRTMTVRNLAIPTGLEPATRGVEIRYSNFVQDSATDDPNDVEKSSIPLDGAESVTVPSRLYSWSPWTVECLARLGQLELPYKAEMLRALPKQNVPWPSSPTTRSPAFRRSRGAPSGFHQLESGIQTEMRIGIH
jgi:hypothetical protein